MANLYATAFNNDRNINFKSSFKVDRFGMLKDLEFENIISSKNFWQKYLLQRYALIEQEIRQILDLIEGEIK